MSKQNILIHLPAGDGKSIQMGPDEVLLFKAVGEETDGVLDCFEVKAAPKAGPPEHIHHQNDEAYYILEGEFMVKIGVRLLKATPGTFCFVPRGTAHTFQSVGIQPGRMLVICTPGGFDGYFKELSQLPSLLDMDQVLPIVQKYHTEVVGPPLGL